MTAQTIASKFRRALRNGTGATFTLEQMQELAGFGVLKMLATKEADELCPENPSSASEIIGSPSAETGSRRTSGRLHPTPTSRGPLSIEALSAGH
ncbi:hypothetical protein [Novosphingobium sp. JCM 18896]|uniref:hypothetical protein n=1 Tax=Novosphingobium sp. JCM 18896 TaxID=2989731 RepID=UPI002223E8A3|nr:hypothetical protein [Novosphingobium sp. JCM 18896]MCW1431351.1 hypothetical protein [Novosphingobium sp. JCM 18896]